MYVKHYFNAKTKKMACENTTKRFLAVRDWTESKEEVTCKRCLAVLAKWSKG